MSQKLKVSKAKAPMIVAAIGASAGGVTALKRFFSRLPASNEIAFVLTQHLDEASRHLAHDFLSREISWPVVEIANGTKIKAGIVYHAPPHATVKIENGIFSIELARLREEQFAAVDNLFRSVAHAYGAWAVAVVLSGDGADGAQGIKAIGDAGGMTLAQTPESAEFASMPQNAIATGAIDHILLPEEMPPRLASYVSYLKAQLQSTSRLALHDEIASALPEICEILHKRTRHDFKHYKTSTLIRRLQRRMQVLQLASVDAYVDRLHSDPREIEALFKELLINVTNFFRDPEAFKTLKNEVLMPALKNRKSDQKYRIWVAGCSTGEEVYSIGILVREVLAKIKKPPEVQIIATDIDEAALNQARKGSYPVTIAEHVSPARLKKYFIRKGGRYHVAKAVREIVLFSSHNLINDPPFSQLDLISCRNVLIYLGLHLQKKLIPVFHYALRPSGHLFLGTSETLTGHKELFRTVSAKHRIAQRKATAIRPPGFSSSLTHMLASQASDTSRNHEADLHLVSQRIILDEFAPKYAVVNDEGQIVSVSGGITEFLDPAEGTFHNNLMKLVKPALRVGLRTAFSEAQKTKRKITHEFSTLKTGEEFVRIGITVQPMPQLGDESSLFMVVFHYFGKLKNAEAKSKAADSEVVDPGVVDQLERELSALRADLDRSVQDLEASNEELKSSNEELLSMNEELQSANEELETSKEDVQNANEALLRSNNDLENLLSSTEIATLFLDRQLRIRSVTPQIRTIYNLTSLDTGRPVTHFTHLAKVMPDYPDLETVTEKILVEDELEMLDGRLILRRVLPYRSTEGEFDGFVVTFTDITHVRVAEARYRQLADSMPLMVWTADPDGHVDYYNARWYEYTGFNRGEHGDGSWKPIIHPDDVQRTIDTWYRSVRTGEPYEIEYRLKEAANGQYRWFTGRAVPIRNDHGEITKWYGSSVDIHDQKIISSSVLESQERYKLLFDYSPLPKWIFDFETFQYLDVNETAVKTYGYTREEFLNMKATDIRPEDEVEAFRRNQSAYFDLERTYVHKNGHHLRKDGTVMNVEVSTHDLILNGRRARLAAVLDVTDRLLAEKKQQQLFENLQTAMREAESARAAAELANESKTRFLANMSHEIRTPLAAILGFSDLLQGRTREGDADAALQLERISRNAAQLGRLIDELLDLSKIEAQRFEVDNTTFDLFSALEDALASVSLRAREKGLIFEQRVAPGVPRMIHTDATRFRQVVINVIGNAVKFTEQGRIDLEIDTVAEGDHSYLRLRVRDTGIGLSEEQQKKIFEPFVQGDASVTRKYGGTGLGLVLSRHLTRLMGGDLRLEESHPGQGSSFVITFALGEVVEKDAARLREVLTIEPKKKDDLLKGRRILIVDDSSDNQMIIKLYLSSAAATTDIANNGLEAIEKMSRQKYDLVLMDIQMPVMDGYQALKNAREAGYNGPIVALTAHAFKEEKNRCLKAGFTDYLSKPVERAVLIQKSNAWIGESSSPL